MTRQYKKIADLIEEISMGPFGSDITVDNYQSSGIPVLNGSNLRSVKLAEDSFKFVSTDKADSFGKSVARKMDLVVTHRGTLGQISYIPDDSSFDRYVISQSQFRVRFKDGLVDPKYAAYYFHTNEGQKRLLSFKSHVGVPALAQATTNFRLLDFPLLPIKTQRDISGVLAAIDEKIENNNKICIELESAAKTLYDYWFIQFEYPTDNEKPYKSSKGKFKSVKGLSYTIPESWSLKQLHDIANITMGQSPSGDSYNDEGVGEVFYQGSTDFGWLFPKTRLYTTQPKKLASKGDILLSVRAPVGDMNIAKEDCCIGRGLAALNSKDGYDGYLYYLMKYYKQVFNLRNSEGTTFGSITKDDLFSLKLVYPPNDVLEKFDEIVSDCNKQIAFVSSENVRLEELRDWLLPMLMNGQVKVKDAA